MIFFFLHILARLFYRPVVWSVLRVIYTALWWLRLLRGLATTILGLVMDWEDAQNPKNLMSREEMHRKADELVRLVYEKQSRELGTPVDSTALARELAENQRIYNPCCETLPTDRSLTWDDVPDFFEDYPSIRKIRRRNWALMHGLPGEPPMSYATRIHIQNVQAQDELQNRASWPQSGSRSPSSISSVTDDSEFLPPGRPIHSSIAEDPLPFGFPPGSQGLMTDYQDISGYPITPIRKEKVRNMSKINSGIDKSTTSQVRPSTLTTPNQIDGTHDPWDQIQPRTASTSRSVSPPSVITPSGTATEGSIWSLSQPPQPPLDRVQRNMEARQRMEDRLQAIIERKKAEIKQKQGK